MKKLLKIQQEPKWILAQVDQVDTAEYGEPDCILVNPVTLDGIPWPPHSADKEVLVRSTDIIVMVDPSDDVLNSTEAKELLNE